MLFLSIGQTNLYAGHQSNLKWDENAWNAETNKTFEDPLIRHIIIKFYLENILVYLGIFWFLFKLFGK